MRKNLIVVAIAFVCASLVACEGKNPGTTYGPSPTTCDDVKAINNGGLLPCRYTFVSIDGITPASGSTIDYDVTGTRQGPSVNFSYEFSPNIPGRVSFQVFFSVDCVSVVGNNNGFTSSATLGMFSGSPSLPRSSGVKQTNCIIVRMARVDANFDTIEVITEAIKPWVFNFE